MENDVSLAHSSFLVFTHVYIDFVDLEAPKELTSAGPGGGGRWQVGHGNPDSFLRPLAFSLLELI